MANGTRAVALGLVGSAGKLIASPTVSAVGLLERLIGTTEFPPLLVTYARDPSGAIAMSSGHANADETTDAPEPGGPIVASTALSAVQMIEMLFDCSFTTYTAGYVLNPRPATRVHPFCFTAI